MTIAEFKKFIANNNLPDETEILKDECYPEFHRIHGLQIKILSKDILGDYYYNFKNGKKYLTIL